MSNLSVYLYNDAGERVWKLTGDEMQVQVNGITSYSNVNFDKTLYASPYLVMDEHEYTKHYYIEGERVCSKIGGGFGPADVLPTSTPLNFIAGDEDELANVLKHLVYNHVECTGYSGNWEISHTLQPAYNTEHNFENKQYFYHPDHLGSSSFITNALGRAEQHLQYLPFGELWINQRNSEFDSPYKFSGKELDSESGYNYFGARYYDSEASIWLSVDPMADARSWVSPYSYVQNSPVMRVDPTGALDVYNTDEWELNKKTGEVKWVKESEKHQLFAVDENGNRTGESVTIKNRDVLDQFSTKGDLDRRDSDGNSVSKGHTTGSIDDVHKVFKFAADNSDVEWGVARYNYNKYALYTEHLPQDILNPAKELGLPNVNSFTHSHPGTENREWSERMSMGEIVRPDTGGRSVAVPSDWHTKIHGGAPFEFYTYFPNSGNLYHVGRYRLPKVSNVGSYRGFYFGVLNHR